MQKPNVCGLGLFYKADTFRPSNAAADGHKPVKCRVEEKERRGAIIVYKFKAENTNFQGVLGYMVFQYHNGEKVVEQFIPVERFQEFCKEAGIEEIEIVNGGI